MAVRMPVEAVAREVQTLEPREKEKLKTLQEKVEDLLYPDVSFLVFIDRREV